MQNEFNQYKALPSASELDPIQFWKINQQTYLCLFYCFKRLACIPASSLPCEQLFSHDNYNIWDRRNQLSPDNTEKMTMIFKKS